MTLTETSTNGHRPDLSGLSGAQLLEAARQAARDFPDLTAPELARMCGRTNDAGQRWARRAVADGRQGAGLSAGTTSADSATPTGADAWRRASAPAASRTPRPVSGRPKSGQPARSPVALRAVTVIASATVAVVTARVSYVHIRDLALTHGMGELASWLPFGVDGLVVTCSCSLLADRWYSQDRRGSLVGWAGVVLGMAGSVAANVLAAPPDWVSRVLAAFSPLALAVSSHQLLRVLGEPARR